MANFEDILRKKSSDVKAPPAYPIGTYHCLVDGPPAAEESSQKKTPCRTYKFKILSAMGDVDQTQFVEMQLAGKLIAGQNSGCAFYITEASVFMYKDFLIDVLGIDPQEGTPQEKDIFEMESEAAGKQLLVKLTHQMSQDNKRTFHRVDQFLHV